MSPNTLVGSLRLSREVIKLRYQNRNLSRIVIDPNQNDIIMKSRSIMEQKNIAGSLPCPPGNSMPKFKIDYGNLAKNLRKDPTVENLQKLLYKLPPNPTISNYQSIIVALMKANMGSEAVKWVKKAMMTLPGAAEIRLNYGAVAKLLFEDMNLKQSCEAAMTLCNLIGPRHRLPEYWETSCSSIQAALIERFAAEYHESIDLEEKLQIIEKVHKLQEGKQWLRYDYESYFIFILDMIKDKLITLNEILNIIEHAHSIKAYVSPRIFGYMLYLCKQHLNSENETGVISRLQEIGKKQMKLFPASLSNLGVTVTIRRMLYSNNLENYLWDFYHGSPYALIEFWRTFASGRQSRDARLYSIMLYKCATFDTKWNRKDVLPRYGVTTVADQAKEELGPDALSPNIASGLIKCFMKLENGILNIEKILANSLLLYKNIGDRSGFLNSVVRYILRNYSFADHRLRRLAIQFTKSLSQEDQQLLHARTWRRLIFNGDYNAQEGAWLLLSLINLRLKTFEMKDLTNDKDVFFKVMKMISESEDVKTNNVNGLPFFATNIEPTSFLTGSFDDLIETLRKISLQNTE